MKLRHSKTSAAVKPRRFRVGGLAVERAVWASRQLEAVWRAKQAACAKADQHGCCRRLRALGLNARQARSICRMLVELEQLEMLSRREAVAYSGSDSLFDENIWDAMTAALDLEQHRVARIHIKVARSTIIDWITR